MAAGSGRAVRTASTTVLPVTTIGVGVAPLVEQVVARGLGRRAQQLGEMVDDDAVALLGQRAVEGAQPGLDVDDGQVEARRGEGARERGVGVALDHDDVGREVLERVADRGDHGADLAVEAGSPPARR